MPAKSPSDVCERGDRSEGCLLNEGRLRGAATGGMAAANGPPAPGCGKEAACAVCAASMGRLAAFGGWWPRRGSVSTSSPRSWR